MAQKRHTFKNPYAVIEIGSTGIRLLVAEISIKEEKSALQKTILDRSEVPVNIGRDVFTDGAISRETQAACLHILQRFAEQLCGWGITPEETTVIGTSAVREAVNRDPFVDRIKVKTQFTVRVIDGIEENRLMYLAVTECLKEESVRVQQNDSIILEIAGGSTEMMLMEKGKMVGAHSLRLGTLIIERQLFALDGGIDDSARFENARLFLEEFIQNTRGTFSLEMNLNKIKQFIAVGSDMNIVSLFAGTSLTPFLWEIKRKDFEHFVDEVRSYTIAEVIAKFKLTYSDAQTFQLSLLAYKEFLSLTSVSTIIVPETSIRDGILVSHCMLPDDTVQKEFEAQILASATTLLRRYQGDELHAEYVRSASLTLYDALESELGLTAHHRLLLEISALLHDIGMFIRAQDHNIHSRYIIVHSEIFGLSKEDTTLVSLVAGFHRGTARAQDDAEFRLLSRGNRLAILKLCAILRVADALDRSHQQKCKHFGIRFDKNNMTLTIRGKQNVSLEKLALTEKGTLFESIFGYKIILETV